MRTLLITVIDAAYKDIGDITLPNMQRYCEKHGYGLEVGAYRTDPSDLLRFGDRGKYSMFEKFYNDYSTIMFLDLDALIMNSDIKIEDVIGDRPFIWTHHVDGPCSGFWIAHTEPIVHLTLGAIANKAPLVGNVRTREELGPPHKIVLEMEPRGQSDQSVMTSLMNTPPYSTVLGPNNCVTGKEAGHCLDYRAIGWPKHFDYLGNWEPGDWIYTAPAQPLNKRIELLRQHALDAI